MENIKLSSEAKQILAIVLTHQAVKVMAFLTATGAVAARDGHYTSLLCVTAYACVIYVRNSVSQSRADWNDRLPVELAADVLLASAVVAAQPGRLALTLLAMHYVIRYARVLMVKRLSAGKS